MNDNNARNIVTSLINIANQLQEINSNLSKIEHLIATMESK